MASDKNELTVAGNLTRDPVMRSTPRGMAVCNFSIANNKYRKNGDVFEKETSFFDVQCWGDLAETVYNGCGKGTPVEVKGRLKQDRWTDRKGKNISKVIIVADGVTKQERQQRQPDDNERHEDYEDRDKGVDRHRGGMCPF
jgi:single-strand DNA-binding protein